MNTTEFLHKALAHHRAGELDTAKAMYRQVLAVQPRNADAHNLLGCVYRSERNLDDAIVSISAAIALDQKVASFYNNLGTCYSAKVERAAAELCFRKALELDPQYADAWSNLGMLLNEASREEESLQVLEKAAELNPEHEGILCNLGCGYLQMHREGRAHAVFAQTMERFPGSAAALLGLAQSLHKLGREEEALQKVEQLLLQNGKYHAEALQLKGTVLEVMGNLDDACAAFDQAIALLPQEVGLLHARAAARKVRAEEPFYAHLMQFDKHVESVRGPRRIHLHYALGKVHQDSGDIAAAAKHYAQGAALQLQASDFDERHDVTLHKLMLGQVTREFISGLRGQGSESAQPIFILGMPRSGTTLVEQLLASHPQVQAGGEMPFVSQVLDGLVFPNGWKVDNGGDAGIAAGLSLLKRAQAYLERVEAHAAVSRHTCFTDKLPENYYNLGLIAAMFPNAKIIHCRRDPVDTAISCYNTLFSIKHYWSYDLATLGRTYRRYWDLMQHWRTELPGRFLELRYEQVVENLEREARKLLDWCGLPWHDGVLRFHETRRPVTTASVTQVRQPLYSTSVGKWKKWEPYIQPLLAEIGEIEKAYWAELES